MRISENTYADPWVFESFLCSDSFARVYGQHLIDEVFGFRSNCVPFWRWKLPEKYTLLHYSDVFISYRGKSLLIK